VAKTGTGGTRTAQLYDVLRADILTGRLCPGQRLKFPDLCQRYAGSVSAVREALTRLASEGLVCNQPHIGFSVMELSVEGLGELTDARVEIEGLVLRRAIADGDLGWEQRVVATHYTLTRTPMFAGDDPSRVSDTWSAAHADFHHALLAGCSNARLLSMAAALRDSAELYRRWSTSLGDEPDRDLAAEHQQMRDLALARDPQAASQALQAHISHTSHLLEQAAQGTG
jgi:DNA-binding GntR family transcriptional regulator